MWGPSGLRLSSGETTTASSSTKSFQAQFDNGKSDIPTPQRSESAPMRTEYRLPSPASHRRRDDPGVDNVRRPCMHIPVPLETDLKDAVPERSPYLSRMSTSRANQNIAPAQLEGNRSWIHRLGYNDDNKIRGLRQTVFGKRTREYSATCQAAALDSRDAHFRQRFVNSHSVTRRASMIRVVTDETDPAPRTTIWFRGDWEKASQHRVVLESGNRLKGPSSFLCIPPERTMLFSPALEVTSHNGNWDLVFSVVAASAPASAHIFMCYPKTTSQGSKGMAVTTGVSTEISHYTPPPQ
ncbi:hypothetical protein K438DRAFT_1773511 [Mycena galopus ATCC 62051]|nr:hypothetical protein K438DRAFT_1773511 [Mycena galopus ATCC 62051]